MRRTLRWIKRIVLGLLAFVVVTVGVVLILLHTDWGRNKAREIALSIAKDIIPGLKIERVDGSVLGELKITGLVIDGLDGKPMLAAKHARANLAISSLFSGTIELEYVELDDVTVVDPRNVVVPNDDPPFGMDVELPRVAIRRANITLPGEQPMHFDSVDLDAALAIAGGGGPISAKADVRGTWREHALPFTVKADAAIAELVKVPSLEATLGDTKVNGTNIVVDMNRPVASLTVHATPAVVAKLAPGVALPAPAAVKLDVTDTGTESRVELAATMGAASVNAILHGDLPKQTARGLIAANGVDIGTYVPRLTGNGSGVISLVLDGDSAQVTAVVRGQFLDLPAGHGIISVDATTKGVYAMIVAGGEHGGAIAGNGELKKTGDRIELVDSRIAARLNNPAAVTAGKIPFKGVLRVAGTAKGSIAPKLAIDLDGEVYGFGLMSTDPKMGGLGIAQISGRASGEIVEAGTFTRFNATLKNVSRGGSLIGTFDIDGRNRRDGKIALTLTARPAAIPRSTLVIDALVSLGKTDTDPISIELGDHNLKAPRVTWAGSGGSIVIGEHAVEVKDIRSRAGNASIAADATIADQIAVTASVQNVPIAMFEPAATGTVSATVDLKRRGITWNGKANVGVVGVQLSPDLPAVDATAAITVAGRRVSADISASTFQVGSVRLAIDVDGPRDITDPVGWRGLERKAIRSALLGVTRIDLAAAKVPTGGIVDGELVLAGADASGTFAVRGVRTPVGMVEGKINFAPMGDDLGIASTLTVENVGEAQIAAQVVIPSHPFEPGEWKKLGRGVLRVLTAKLENVQIDPRKLALLGVEAPYRGRASVEVKLAAGAGEATALVQARASRKTEWTDTDPRLFTVTAGLPVWGFEQWLGDVGQLMATRVEGKLAIPDIDVVQTLAMFGRADVQSGRLTGAIDIAGTLAAPTAGGELVVTKVNVKPRVAGRKLPTLDELKVQPTWDGKIASVVITGKESDGATLDIRGKVDPAALDKLSARVVIKKFDIAPIAVFLPGPLVAATGKISADVTVNGLAIDKIRGELTVDKARVPVHPQVGTVRDANVNVKLSDAGLKYKLSAKLGAGTIKLEGGARPDLAVITFDGAVEKLSPIGEIQPIVNATIEGTIFNEEGLLRADAKLTKTNVTLDMSQGVQLLDAEMPDDLFIGRKTAPPPVPKQARLPRKPWITVKVAVESTPVYVKHEFFEVRARVNANKGITLLVGRQFGMDGSIEIERGDVDVLGRHYRVDPGPDKIRFDGTADPLLAIRLTHDFPELTLTADIVGRASKREIVMTGTPAIYTQDELFAFFIGGDPGSGSTTRDVAANAGAAYLSAKLQRHAKKVIPFKVDVVACDAGTSASSSSCKLGRWLTENWFVAFKQRIEPRQDEPPQEVQLQYYFRRNWVIEAAGFTERFGGDVLWRKRW